MIVYKDYIPELLHIVGDVLCSVFLILINCLMWLNHFQFLLRYLIDKWKYVFKMYNKIIWYVHDILLWIP